MPLPSNKRLALVAAITLALVVFLVTSQHSAVVSGLPTLASFTTYALPCIPAVPTSLIACESRFKDSEASDAPLASSSASRAAAPSFPDSLPLLHPSERLSLPLVEAIADFTVLPSPDQVRINVTVCAVPTHEISYLPEWIVWHRLLGVGQLDQAASVEVETPGGAES
jgi:hypothetical protein